MAHIQSGQPPGEPTLERVRRLSEGVRRSLEVHRDTMHARNAALADASEAGYSDGQIARAAGLRRQTVMSIVCDEATARVPAAPSATTGAA